MARVKIKAPSALRTKGRKLALVHLLAESNYPSQTTKCGMVIDVRAQPSEHVTTMNANTVECRKCRRKVGL